MKLKLVLLSLLFATITLAQTLQSPLRITRPNRSNLLTWTNHMHANVPVYQILRSTNLALTNWQHFFYVTNANSTTFTDTPGGVTGMSSSWFYKVAWVSETPMTFEYEFDEGYGAGPCVSGQMTVSFLRNGTWNFNDDGFCFDEGHVTGSGTLRPRWSIWTPPPHMARFDLTAAPNPQYIEATLQSRTLNGTLMYTGMVGTVYQEGFAGGTPLGTFKARRTQ